MSIDPFPSFQPKDSADRIRLVEPDTPPPFERKRLVLKQIDPGQVDELGRQALSLFTVWSDTWEAGRSQEIESIRAMLAEISPHELDYEVRTDTRPNRRFSGDGTLARARYHALCRADGDDAGTLRRELEAYHDPWTKGLIQISEAADGSEIHLSIPPITATRHDWLRDAAHRWQWTDISLPVTIQAINCERLIDLRTPRAADWFTRNLSQLRWIANDGSAAPAFPRKGPLTHFTDLLPSLLTQMHGGGNGPTRIAGQWLRALGADALVFPSARSDSEVTVENGEVVSFAGWNLVDYREAEPVRVQTYDLTTDWPAHIATEVDQSPLSSYADISLKRTASPDGGASWSWKGIAHANSALRSAASALHLYAWAHGDAGREQLQLVARILGATDRAEVMRATSNWFAQALLGDRKARAALVQSLPELSSQDAAILDLQQTFSLMDSRIADGKAGLL